MDRLTVKANRDLNENYELVKSIKGVGPVIATDLLIKKGNIRRWIEFVIRSKRKLAGLKTFARGLLRDICAVENVMLFNSHRNKNSSLSYDLENKLQII